MYNILFRNSIETHEEFSIAKKYFNVIEYRSQIPNNSIVIGRYSVLPYYEELEKELASKNEQYIVIETSWKKEKEWIIRLKIIREKIDNLKAKSEIEERE